MFDLDAATPHTLCDVVSRSDSHPTGFPLTWTARETIYVGSWQANAVVQSHSTQWVNNSKSTDSCHTRAASFLSSHNL